MTDAEKKQHSRKNHAIFDERCEICVGHADYRGMRDGLKRTR